MAVLTDPDDIAGELNGGDSILEHLSRADSTASEDRWIGLARIAAAVAVGATTDTYRRLTRGALAAAATVEEIVGTLLAVAPTVGAARVVAAAPRLAESLGYDVGAALEDIDGGTGVHLGNGATGTAPGPT